MPFDLLVHNATVVTVNAAMETIENGFVGITDGVIAAVDPLAGKDPLPEATEYLDAKGGVVMPGLVNAHTHLPMTLFRGLADDLPLQRWLEEVMFPAEATHVDAASARSGALLACAEMLLSGTTCCCDGYFHAHSVAEAVEEAGLRAVIAQGIIDFPAPGVPDPSGNVRHAEDFVERWQGRSMCITPSIFCHAPYTCSPETLQAAVRTARRHDVLFQIHLSETQGEVRESLKQNGRRPALHLDDLGVIDDRCLAVHCIWVDKEEIQTLARRRVSVAHCPSSNMKLGSGVAPVEPLRSSGVALGLGTDGCASNNTLDMFREMTLAAKLHKVHRLDPTAACAENILRMATVGSAEAMGLGGVTGSIETGKRADLIVVDTDRPHLTPMYSPVSHAVYAMNGNDVRDVMVDGRLRVRNGKLVAMDLDKVMADVREIAGRVSGAG